MKGFAIFSSKGYRIGPVNIYSEYAAYSFFLNGEKVPTEELCRAISSISDRTTIIEKGGFLFKASFFCDEIHFGILPYVVGGERMWHYNIIMKREDAYRITGFINSNYTITVIPDIAGKNIAKNFSAEMKSEFSRRMRLLADILIRFGFDPNFKVDAITLGVLEMIGYPGTKFASLQDIKDANLNPFFTRKTG